jgi:hypothetical protein
MTTTQPLTFRGIEITAANYRHLTEHGVSRNSDLYLTADATFGRGGFARASRALLTVPEDVRESVWSEGNITSNVTGCRFADGIEQAAQAWNAGRRTFPMTEANRAMLARERAATAASGRFVPESIDRAFPGLAGSRVR